MIERDLPTAENIASCRLQFEHFSEAELITRANKEPHGASGIAAKQLLVERQAAVAAGNHRELLAEIRKPHWSVTPGFLVGAVAAVASIVAAIYAYLAYAQQVQSGSIAVQSRPVVAPPLPRVASAPHPSPKRP